MICPMLSQSHRETDGTVVWDHHDCIESACTFWAAEQHDCAIRASGLLVIKGAVGQAEASQATRKIEERLGAVSDKHGTALREMGLTLLQGISALEEPLQGWGAEIGTRLESINTSLLTSTTTMEGKLAETQAAQRALKQELQQVAGAIQQNPSWVAGMEQSVKTLSSRLAGVAERFVKLSDHLETLAGKVAGLQGTHETLSVSLKEESTRRDEEHKRRQREAAREINTRGVALYHQGALQGAEGCFRAALENDHAFAEAHNNLGLCLSKLGKEQEAEACFARAIEIDPRLTEAINNLGFLFHQGTQFDKAVEMFRRAALSSQDSSVAWTNMGNACYKLGRHSEAVEAWRKAVDANPANENAARALRMFQQAGAGS